jgi:hypothetical protein
MAVPLLSLAQAKAQLRIAEDDHSRDDEVYEKVEEASAIIIDYLKIPEAEQTWTEDTVPWHVRAAVKLMLTHLNEHAGDDMSTDDNLWNAVRRLLERSRDPTLA